MTYKRVEARRNVSIDAIICARKIISFERKNTFNDDFSPENQKVLGLKKLEPKNGEQI